MLDYLCDSAAKYQKLHGLKPNLLYLNNNHFQSLQYQLDNQHKLSNRFNEFDLIIVLSPTMTHPSLAYI